MAQWGTEAVTLLRAGFARQAFRRLVRDKSGTSYVRNAGIVGVAVELCLSGPSLLS